MTDGRGDSGRRAISRRDLLRAGAVVGASVGAGVTVGCSADSTGAPGAATPPARPTGTLRVASVEPKTFDPALANDQGELGIISHDVYESLLRFKGDTLELEGMLAESYEVSSDAREWTFRLRKGVTFHDGEPFTSDAVKASFERYADADVAWPFMVPAKAEYDVSDPQVVRVKSRTPFPDLGRNAAFIRMVSPKLLKDGKDALDDKPVGTGPFTFESYATAEQVVLAANPEYWRDGPYLERVEFKIISDPAARASALRSGSVDIVTKVAPSELAALRGDPNLAVDRKRLWSQSQLLFFLTSPPADNLKLRQAIAYAIDRKAIVRSIHAGVGEVHDSVVPPDVYGYHSPKTQYPFDLAKAKQLVRESGLPTPIQVEAIWAPELGANVERMEQAIAEMVKKIGVQLKVTQKPLAQIGKEIFDPKFDKPYQSAVGDTGWLTGGPLFFGRKYFQTVCGFDDYDALNDEMLTTKDGPKRLRLLAEIQEMFAQRVPIVPIYAVVGVDVRKKTVRGYVKPKDGFMPNFSTVYLAQ